MSARFLLGLCRERWHETKRTFDKITVWFYCESATRHQARITGIRVTVAADVLRGRLDGLPEGVTIAPGRIEVQFSGPREAVGRLFALAQALTNDYERFEVLVSGEGPHG